MNKQIQKVIDGLRHHGGLADWGCWKDNEESDFEGPPKEVCPYFDDDKCQAKLMIDAVNLLKEYDIALRMMVYQYCVDSFKSAIDIPERFNHSFMSAGETAFKVLDIENGEEVTDDFIWS